MPFPIHRPRRLRRTPGLRALVRETSLSVNDLIYPMFVVPGRDVKAPIDALPGQHHFSVDRFVGELSDVTARGIKAVILFGKPERKDETGSEGWSPDGAVQRAVAAAKDKYPGLVVMTDVCVDAYTSHGHCGMVRDGRVVNDESLEVLARIAVSHARAGADLVAPSDMMDGRVGAIRQALDGEGFEDIAIMAYSAKYASAFYGPFREATGGAPQFGDRTTYQMDPGNAREAEWETLLDVEEGADIVMVKPALSYLDVIRRLKETFDQPVAAYNVSGEYSMVKAAAQRGWVDERRAVMEILLSMKRAGADMILTYHAPDVAVWLER